MAMLSRKHWRWQMPHKWRRDLAGKEQARKKRKWAKKGKTTGLVTINMLDHNKKQSIKEKMQKRGERAMDDEMGFQMDVQIEWAMADSCKKFNIRAVLITILEKIKTVDNRMYIKSSVTNHIWKDLSDIPTGKEFSKA
eukprot:5877260-Ditylum_brightwellii.AAC.1